MEVKTMMVAVLVIMVGSILLASMLPTALDAVYSEDSSCFSHQKWSSDVNGKAIACNKNESDTASAAIYNLFPLFTVLGGLGILVGVGLKEYGYI